MKNFLIYSFLFLLIACRKEDNSSVTATPRIDSTYTSDECPSKFIRLKKMHYQSTIHKNDTANTLYFYDAQNRLDSIDQKYQTFTLVYGKNKKPIKKLHHYRYDFLPHKVMFEEHYEYDSNGFLTKVIGKNDADNDGKFTENSRTVYIYNQNGQVATEKHSFNQDAKIVSRVEYTWEGENISKVENFDENDKISHRWTYKYGSLVNIGRMLETFGDYSSFPNSYHYANSYELELFTICIEMDDSKPNIDIRKDNLPDKISYSSAIRKFTYECYE